MNKLLLKKDLYSLFKNKKINLFLIIVFGLIFYIKLLNKTPLEELYVNIMGMNFSFIDFYWLDFLIYIYFILFYSYIVIYLFTNDIKNDFSNIFLRTTPKKYIKNKINSICFSTLLILVLLNVIILLLELIFIGQISINFIIIIKQLLFICLIQNIVLFTYIFSSKNISFLFLILLFVLIEIKFVDLNIILYNNWYMLFINMFLDILIYISYSKYYKEVFEINKEISLWKLK